MRTSAAVFAAVLSLSTASAQDSVSISGCFPGDAVEPWTDIFGPNFSEQTDAYVVDLAPAISSWGSTFGVAPIAKSGKSNAGVFFTSLMRGNGISRDMLVGQRFTKGSYDFWNQPGFGVNNDPTLNMPGTPINTETMRGTQFGVMFVEGSTTGSGSNYQGAVTAVVNIDPANPNRLFVNKIQAATNACDGFSDLAALGGGSVDANGNTIVRADGFGVNFGGCGFLPLPPGSPNNNVFLIDALLRNGAFLNVLSDTASSLDGVSTQRIINNSVDTFSTPGLVPESVNGGAPRFIGVNFAGQYVQGVSAGTTAASNAYLDATFGGGSRGNISYMSQNFAPTNSTGGVCGVLGVTSATDGLNIWGIDGAGAVTGTLPLLLPNVVVDNSTGYQNASPGTNQFDHYHSQVAFQGGNGQVALGIDSAGNLIAAAQVDHDATGGSSISANNWGANYIAVCKVDPVTSAQSWTMAGYIDPITSTGKPILDGPGGNPVWQMQDILTGPSVSSPMIDAAGNIYFLSFIEKLDGTFATSIGLIKAVYDVTTFSYELELVLRTGSILAGPNSGRNYIITSLRLTDSDSIASDAPFSQNITERGFLGYPGDCFNNSDPRTLGGIAVAANIIYDSDNDGQFDGDDCQTTGSIDEEYRVMLYVGAMGESGIETTGNGCPGSGGFTPGISWAGYPSSGKPVTFTIDRALGGQTALLFISPFGTANIPVGGGCFFNVASPFVGPFAFPLFGAGFGEGIFSVTTAVPTLPPGATLTFQAFCTDPGTVIGASSTKALTVTFQ